jgi:type I restriction enzyme, S subunit
MGSKERLQVKLSSTGIIPKGWAMRKIGECCNLVREQFQPSKDDVRPYIGLEHIEQQSLKLSGVGSSKEVESNKFKFKSGQILFGKLRPYFRKVYLPKFDGVCSTDIWVINTKEPNDNIFFFYFFADQRIINKANNSSEGTKMPRARWDYLEQLEYPIPQPTEQRAIAKILSDLDSKIELSQKMNRTLEAIGQAVFKRWFVDFEFPNEEGKPYKSSGGEMLLNEMIGRSIPKGWQVGAINDLCSSITNGGTPRRMESAYWNGSIPWFKTGELTDGPLIDSEEHITEEGLRNSAARLWAKNTILVALYASPTVGRLGLLRTKSASNQACSGLVAKEEIGYSFLFYTLFFKRSEFNNIAVGAAQQNISQQIVRESKIVIPPTGLLKSFNNIANSFFDKQSAIVVQNRTISQIRDKLLPKLMSGRIRVPVANENTEQS